MCLASMVMAGSHAGQHVGCNRQLAQVVVLDYEQQLSDLGRFSQCRSTA